MTIRITKRSHSSSPLSISDDLERGSIDKASSSVTSSTGEKPVVTIVPRLQETTGVTKTWFFAFELENSYGKIPSFTVSFADNYGGDPEIASGYAPWFTTDRASRVWTKFDTASYSSPNLTFSHSKSFASDRVIVAYLPIYGLTELSPFIADMKASSYTSPAPNADADWVIGYSAGQTDDLGRSLGPLPLYGFKLTNSAVSDTGKQVCYLDMGMHGSEDMGNWAGESMVNYILSPAGLDLLDDWVFLVYPMNNPAGRTGGHFRGQWDPGGLTADPNRSLNSTPPVSSTLALKTAWDIAVVTHPPDVFLAFHAWQEPLFSYYDQGGAGNEAFRTTMETVSGESHNRWGDSFSGSTSWYFNSKGASISRVAEVGQAALSDMSQMEDFGRWHAEALRFV